MIASEQKSIVTKKHEPAVGNVIEVSGTVMDIEFPRDAVPHIFNQLHIIIPAGKDFPEHKASVEVAQQLGDGIVRCIALENIFGICRGLRVIDTGGPIQVPVGDEVLGRIFDVLGDTIDEKEPLKNPKGFLFIVIRLPLSNKKLKMKSKKRVLKL